MSDYKKTTDGFISVSDLCTIEFKGHCDINHCCELKKAILYKIFQQKTGQKIFDKELEKKHYSFYAPVPNCGGIKKGEGFELLARQTAWTYDCMGPSWSHTKSSETKETSITLSIKRDCDLVQLARQLGLYALDYAPAFYAGKVFIIDEA
jgi:hypothetical protein